MRIIAGEFRGRRLVAPDGQETRPMLDRVREAMFSTLGARVPGARVLDLFAGTGSLGLEALSRGASTVRFLERSPRAARVLRENIASLLGDGAGERVQVVVGDASAPSTWGAGAESGAAVDIAFLDPPYAWLEDAKRQNALRSSLHELLTRVLAPDGMAVLHTPRRARIEHWLAAEFVHDRRDYGNSSLWYLDPVVTPS